MGNSESSDYTNQQQYIQQLQHQIKKNRAEIDKMKLMKLNSPSDYNLNRLKNSINNRHKNNSHELNQSIIQNNVKLNKIKNLLQSHRHVMTQEQYKKVIIMKKTLEQSNHILIQQLSELNNVVKKSNTYLDSQYSENREFNQNNHYSTFNIGTNSQVVNDRQLQRQDQLDTIGKITKHYKNDEERELIEFEIEEKKRKQQFLDQQRKRRMEYQNKIQELDRENINSLKLFGLNENYTLGQLKNSYKKLAIKTHPDRPDGSNEKFQLVTKCYMSLLEKYKLRESDKTYHNLREESKKYIQEQKGKNTVIDKENFNLKLFNKLYEENKLWDPNDNGYDDWLKDEKKDVEETPLFGKKFNLNIFNSTFENNKNKNNNEIIEYKDPQSMISTNIGFTDIDNSNEIKDFTKPVDGHGNIGYTDLKTAYTNRGALIDPNSVEYKTYNSIDELKRDRSKISYTMTPEQIREVEIQKLKDRENEEFRQQRIRERDLMISQNYSKVHQSMLGYQSNVE